MFNGEGSGRIWGRIKMVRRVSGRKWRVGDICYALEDTAECIPFEYRVKIEKEKITPKYGRGEEYGYYVAILGVYSPDRRVEEEKRELYVGNFSHYFIGSELTKRPKLKEKRRG